MPSLLPSLPAFIGHLLRFGLSSSLAIVLTLFLSCGLMLNAYAAPEQSKAAATPAAATKTATTAPASTSGSGKAASVSTADPNANTSVIDNTQTKAQIQTLLDKDAGLQLSNDLSTLGTNTKDQVAVTSESIKSFTEQELSVASLGTLLSNIEHMDANPELHKNGSIGPDQLINALKKKLDERTTAIADDSNLDEDTKNRATTAITQAKKMLEDYITLRTNAQKFAQEQEQAQSLVAELEQNLAQANQTFTQEPPPIDSRDLEVVNALNNELTTKLNNLKHEISLVTATYNSLQTLPARNQNQILQNNERIYQLQQQIDNLATSNLLQDEQILLPFEKLLKQKQNILLQNEIRSMSVLQDVANYKIHIYNLQKSYLENYLTKVHAHQSELLSEQSLIVEKNKEDQENQQKQEPLLPQLQSEIKNNQDLSANIKRALAQQNQLQRALQEVDLALTATEQIKRNIQEQLSDLSGSIILTRLLNRQQGELPQIEMSFNFDELIPNLNLWIYDLRGYREGIFDVQNYINGIIKKTAALESVREQLEQVIRQRRVLYEDLYGILSDSLTIANELRTKYNELQTNSQQVRSLINDHLFWLASNQGISLDFFKSIGPNIAQQASDLWQYLCSDFLKPQNLFNYLKIFFPIIFIGTGFFLSRQYFRNLTNKLALRLDKRTDSYILTPFAIINHFFLIIPRVCLITLLGSMVIFITLDNFDDQIVLTFYLSLHVICFLYVRHIMEPNSLEQRHFEISPDKLANRRVIIDQLWFIGIPMLTIANMREIEPTKLPNDSIGYLLMLLGFFYLTIFAIVQAKRLISKETPSMTTLTLLLVGIITPMTITVMLGLGYYYTVIQLLNRVAITLYLGFLYLILSQTLRRELHVTEVKLTNSSQLLALNTKFNSLDNIANDVKLVKKGKKTTKTRNAGFNRILSNNSTTNGSAADSPSMTVTRLMMASNRIFKLCNTFLLVLFLFFMYLQWNDLAGVLDYLNHIYLWQSQQVIDGKVIVNALTLKDLLVTLLIIGITILLNRNLPMLIEHLILLRSNNNTKSISYTIKLLFSYLITALGTILAAGSLGISWDSLQWLVAALSVGLGFGLQEIFANFVSGIIILFERQLRVGDIVTLSGLSGTVSKIRIRATTIISFENMEVVIPNRQFITTALTNWSLSNTVTKIVFTIGVAYGTDVKKAKRLLAEILRQCPNIDRDRQAVYVQSLDDSAITLMCEVFVNEIGKRKAVIDFLSVESLRVFAENDIEIPFNQMDVNIRNLDTDKILQFVAAQNGVRPKDLDKILADIKSKEQAALQGDANNEGTNAEQLDNKKAESDPSMGARLMRLVGVKNS